MTRSVCRFAMSAMAAMVLAPALAQADVLVPAGEWQIVDINGNQLGILVMDPARIGSGDIEGGHPDGQPGPVTVRPYNTSAEAFDVILSPVGIDVPDEKKARLLFNWPRGETARGSLFDTDGRARPVTMRWLGSGVVDPSEDGTAMDGDYPAIGIWRPEYEIVNVPPGGSVPLRKTPDRNGPQTGALPSGSRAIWARQCVPEIETEAFEAADLAGKMKLLSASWCEVEQASQVGFLPGFHLRPLD